MNEEEQKAADVAAAAAAKEEAAAKADEDSNSQEDPLKQELDKIEDRKTGRTKLEKAQFARRKIDEEIARLEEDEGVKPEIDEDDEKPVTVGMLKQRERETAQKTAIDLADNIEDETEKKLVKHYLSNRINPSGNPSEDLELARSIVNSKRNSLIAEEAARKKTPQRNGNGNGAPAKVEDQFTPTTEELSMMRAPFNLTKEEVIASRPKN